MSNFKLFSGSANPEFAKKVGEYLGMPVSDATLNKFSDGEI
ncbi:MAG: ribose-phosphate pyrophosphokinase, partial [Erysipelotrichia bacterium]|nr:ribose-phosphate pyrophosphokinase [Erysipelotrichia bacterium]